MAGKLDFAIIGLLAQITALLAREKISVFAVSTFNTDYILVREGDLERSLAVFAAAGDPIEMLDESK